MLMAFVEDCIERGTALAATCGWLAIGGGAEAAVGLAIGGAGLASIVSASVRRHGPESEAALRRIRVRIARDLERHAEVERWGRRGDIAEADAAMERALAGCFLERAALAATARSPEGFPVAATRLILAELARREPGVFGPGGPAVAREHASLVIRTALEAALENEAYFRNLDPHLTMEMLRGIGVLEAGIRAVHEDVGKILEIVSRLSLGGALQPVAATVIEPEVAGPAVAPLPPAELDKMELEFAVNDEGRWIIFHDRPFPLRLQRIEYDWDRRLLQFVFPGGFNANWGIPLQEGLHTAVTAEINEILVVLTNEEGRPVEGENLPFSILGGPHGDAGAKGKGEAVLRLSAADSSGAPPAAAAAQEGEAVDRG